VISSFSTLSPPQARTTLEVDGLRRVRDALERGVGPTVEIAVLGENLRVSREFLELIYQALDAVAQGDGVVVVRTAQGLEDANREDIAAVLAADTTASPASMTSQEAADLLNVSRPYVVKLARKGELPHTKVGNRHRFRHEDVLEYAERMRSVQDDALRKLAPEGGYTQSDF
jgi:excisionase family DNA binding protein